MRSKRTTCSASRKPSVFILLNWESLVTVGFAIPKNLKRKYCLFKYHLFAFSVEYTFRYEGKDDKEEVEELSPQRLE